MQFLIRELTICTNKHYIIYIMVECNAHVKFILKYWLYWSRIDTKCQTLYIWNDVEFAPKHYKYVDVYLCMLTFRLNSEMEDSLAMTLTTTMDFWQIISTFLDTYVVFMEILIYFYWSNLFVQNNKINVLPWISIKIRRFCSNFPWKIIKET